MGYLGYGDERLVIHSRFGNEENDFFFQYLLEKVLDMPNIVDMTQFLIWDLFLSSTYANSNTYNITDDTAVK